MMKTYFDNHVFHNELEAKLLRLVDRSDRLPPFIILYGEPGTGKTSFAKWFAEEYASCMNYFPINETGLNKEVWHKISRCHTTASLYDEGKPISRLVILDEFHNATRNQQDKFKTLYDQISERDIGVQFIFVLNTNARVVGKQIHDLLSPAMYSRMYRLSFDVPERLVDEVVEKSKRLYPGLSENEIRATLPDHRQLALKQSLAEWAA